jgi:hypothetical protein
MLKAELTMILNSVRTPNTYKVLINDEATGKLTEVESVNFNTKLKAVCINLKREASHEHDNQSGPAPV